MVKNYLADGVTIGCSRSSCKLRSRKRRKADGRVEFRCRARTKQQKELKAEAEIRQKYLPWEERGAAGLFLGVES